MIYIATYITHPGLHHRAQNYFRAEEVDSCALLFVCFGATGYDVTACDIDYTSFPYARESMVFESLLVDILNRYLRPYVKHLDTSQLKVGVWKGT